MSTPLLPPPERDLPGPAGLRMRAELVTRVDAGRPGRRWLPLAAAAAAAAVVGGSAVLVSGSEPAPTTPAAPTEPVPTVSDWPPIKVSPSPGPPPPPAPPPPTEAPVPPGTPSLTEVRQRCELPPQSRYVTRYVDDEAVTWLFVQPEKFKTSTVCTWKIGNPGRMANFTNDWLVPPTPGGRYESTRDDMMPGFAGGTVPPGYEHFERDRWVLVGKVPDAADRALIRSGDEVYVPGFADGWFVFHYRGEETELELFGYDAAGELVPQR